MALQSSGVIAMSDINVELGNSSTATISLNDASVRSLLGIGSGTIGIANAYGKSNGFGLTIASNQTDLNLASYATGQGWNGSSTLTVTIDSGVTIYSTSTATPALTISGSFPGGVELVNNGTIVGKGGAANSGAGGTALSVSSAVSIENNGTIGGGGGGGGKGGTGGQGSTTGITWGSWQYTGNNQYSWARFNTGICTASGAGIYYGGMIRAINSGPTNDNDYNYGGYWYRMGSYQTTLLAAAMCNGPVGPPGGDLHQIARGTSGTTYTDGGAGGNGGTGQTFGASAGSGSAGSAGGTNAGAGGTGGAGGTWGGAGSTGATGTAGNYTAGSAGSAGGSGGSAVSGNSNITWVATGTRLGAVA